jgi:hypothetical protein
MPHVSAVWFLLRLRRLNQKELMSGALASVSLLMDELEFPLRAANSTVSLPCSEFNRSSSTANLV